MNKRGQSTLEYGILIAVVVGALIAMSVYMKRGLQGRLRTSTDDIGEQFSPAATTSSYTTTSESVSSEVNTAGVTTTTISKDARARTGTETVGALDSETWK
ncbi:MAG: class III signal peptide-containing protein [Candidatus Omnitrophica bacterium]|nr:class III signal peptide-containing protein [Candidatus Omnitrophota bacterium]MBU2221777.1 class III signal peptide-containing protein [Candidatus Omnitrophota bacterium]